MWQNYLNDQKYITIFLLLLNYVTLRFQLTINIKYVKFFNERNFYKKCKITKLRCVEKLFPKGKQENYKKSEDIRINLSYKQWRSCTKI